jgi:hypothetical protein
LSNLLISVSFKRIKVFAAQIPVFWFHNQFQTHSFFSIQFRDSLHCFLCFCAFILSLGRLHMLQMEKAVSIFKGRIN